MRKFNFILVLLASVFSATLFSCGTDKSSEVIEEMVDQYNSPAVQQMMLSTGVFSEVKAERSGKDIVIKMTFSVPQLDLATLSREEKAMFRDEFVSQFKYGFNMSAGNKADEVLDVLKDAGTNFIMKIGDYHGNTMDVTVPVSDL